MATNARTGENRGFQTFRVQNGTNANVMLSFVRALRTNLPRTRSDDPSGDSYNSPTPHPPFITRRN
jgi:hypothetical protein